MQSGLKADPRYRHGRASLSFWRATRAVCWIALLVGVWQKSVAAQDVQQVGSATTGLTGPSRFTSGDNRLLIFAASMESGSNRTISSASYGGRSLTQIDTRSAGTSPYDRAYLFYLKEADIATASSNNFSVSWSGSTDEVRYAAVMFSNVDQENPIRDSESASTNSSSPNPIVASNLSVLDGDMVVSAALCGNPDYYSWNNSFSELTDQSGSTSRLSLARRSVTSSGSMYASASNSDPNRQVILAATVAKMVVPTNYYVRPDGSNSNSGTGASAGQAWRTITNAVRDSPVSAGDIVYVMSGTYNEEVRPNESGSSGTPIQVIADTTGDIFGGSGGAVLVQAPSSAEALSMSDDDYFEFHGFTWRGNGSNYAVLISDSDGVQLKNCEITNGTRGVQISGSSSSLTLVNVLIHNNSDDAIHMDNGTLSVWNCTIVDNDLDAIEQDAGTSTVRNSILAYNNADGFDLNGGSMSHSYNLVYGNGDNNFEGVGSSTGETSQNPQFVDRGSEDYRLSSESPAINVGTNAAGTVDDDLDGNGRPIGSGWDLGCYEYALLGHWQFEEGSGFSSSDSSGNGHTASLYGDAAWTAARCGYAITLGGSLASIDLGQIDFSAKAYSATAWFKTSAKTQQTIISVNAASSANHLMFLELDADGHVQLTHRSPVATSGGSTVASSASYNDGIWHHVAAVKSNSQLLLYVDGELVGQMPDNSSVHSAVDVELGVSNSSNYFVGSLDEVRLYGSAISATDLANLLGMVGRWRLDETSGSVAVDSSPLGNHGTFRNGVSLGEQGPNSQLKAVEFDGTNGYVELPTIDADFSNGLTITVWAKPTATKNWARFIDLGQGAGNDNILFTRRSTSNTLQFEIYNGSLGGAQSIIESNTVTNNQWRHYAVTVDSSGLARLYLDGEEIDNKTIGLPQNVARNYSYIARSNWSGDAYFEGQMYDVRLYNRPLCLDELADIHQSGSSSGGLRIIKWVEVK